MLWVESFFILGVLVDRNGNGGRRHALKGIILIIMQLLL